MIANSTKRFRRILILFLSMLAVVNPFNLLADEVTIGVDKVALRDAPSFLSPPTQMLKYGDQCHSLEIRPPWVRVQFSGHYGWIHQQALGDKKSIMADIGKGKLKSDQVSDDEVSLTAKGFSAAHEDYYRQQNQTANFSDVDVMESYSISDNELLLFIKEGGLNEP